MKEKRKPGFGAAMLPILVMAFVLGIGFGKFRLKCGSTLTCLFLLYGAFRIVLWNNLE